jgi:hypothetical protein
VKPLVCLLACVVGLSTVRAAGGDIDPDHLLAHVRFLASDNLRGRGDGSVELDRAADYIARQFSEIGLTPGGDGASWFQPFDLVAGVRVGPGNVLRISNGGTTTTLSLGSTYYPLSATPAEAPGAPSAAAHDLPVVFGGYGLAAPNIGYDDYAGIDVSGKAVLIFSHEPQEADAASPLNGRRPMPETTLYKKAEAARAHGARLLIVVSDPSHQRDEGLYEQFNIVPEVETSPLTVLRVRREAVQPLIDAWTLDATAAAIERDLRPRSRLLDGASVDYDEFLSVDRRQVRNVVGVLKGADSGLASEAVVIGAHYDHVGLGGRLSISPERTGEIHNGADDNASGTASVIEIARAATAQRARFPRSIVFVAFAGEERGLLGSAHYIRTPTMPLSNTVAMLNLDMVGRSNGKVNVSGVATNSPLDANLLAAARAVGALDISRAGPGAGRSDDSSFIDARIPAVNFFTGFHADYHRPTDDWEKIDKAGAARVATLALEFAARIADSGASAATH